MSTRTIKAVCVVEVQVECDSTWSEETTMAQILKQAETDARHQLNSVFADAVTPDSELRIKRPSRHGVSLLGVKKIETRAVEQR